MATYGHVEYFPFVAAPYAPPAGKAGVGIATQAAEVVQATSAKDAGAVWYYNWSVHPELRGLPLQVGAEFVPMVWRGGREVAGMPCGLGTPVLWLNEPNEPGQATMTPAEAADLLERLLAVCATNRYIGPNVSHRDWHVGWPWLVAFYTEWERRHGVAPPTVLAMHLYAYPLAFASTINTHYQALARWVEPDDPIWITEYNVPCGPKSSAEVAPLLAEATRILESDNRVERYAVFALHNGGRWPGSECGELVDESGRMTEAGRAFRDTAVRQQQIEALEALEALEAYP
jgi:hypothetical protein